MGGEIDFVSVEDVGTRFFFTVEFPRAGVGGGAGAAIAKARSPTPRESGEKNAETETALRRGSVDAVLDAGSAGGLGSSDGSITPSASRARRTAKRRRMFRMRARGRRKVRLR
jgi:hypothetical protein